jgi:hypothetical protein
MIPESCHKLCRLLRKYCQSQNAAGEVGRASLRGQEIGKHDLWLENDPQSFANSSRSVLELTTVLLRRDDECSHSLKNGVVQSGMLKGGSLQSMHAERQ